MKAIELLNSCIEQLNNMSQEEFDALVKKKKLDQISYDEDKYIDSEFKILLPSQLNSPNKNYQYLNSIINSLNVKELIIDEINYKMSRNLIKYSNECFEEISMYIEKLKKVNDEICVNLGEQKEFNLIEQNEVYENNKFVEAA